MVDYGTLRASALVALRQQLDAAGMTDDDFDDSTDLLATGLVDSFGWIDLVSRIETETGVSIDYNKLTERSDLGSLRGLLTAILD